MYNLTRNGLKRGLNCQVVIRLEIRCTGNGTVGSNPTRSAKSRETLKSVSLFLFMGFILASATRTHRNTPASSEHEITLKKILTS